ncbi:MAG: hypothetical protein ACR2KK_24095 [Acidimicrobiales bacterium]
MPDPRLEALAGVVARVGGAACWLARLATRAAVVGAAAGTVLWSVVAGDRVDEWWQGTLASLLVLALCLSAPGWLWNVRSALHELVELPEKLGDVTSRRAGGLRRARPQPDRPDGGALGAVRSVRGVLRDYGDVVGSWGTVAQLVVPSFWLLTVAALVTVPVLVVVAALAALVAS